MINVGAERIFGAQVQKEKGKWACSLAPIRDSGEDSVNLHPIPGLVRVHLAQVLKVWNDLNHLVPEDAVVPFRKPRAPVALVPSTGRLASATFLFYLADSPIPRSVTITPPGTLQVERTSDTEIVIQWAIANGFLSDHPPNRSVSDEQSMAIP